MPIDVPKTYPCSICENFAGRYPWHGEPAVVYEDEDLYIIMAPAALGGTDGHVLVCPRRHVETLLELRPEEAAVLGRAVALPKDADAPFPPANDVPIIPSDVRLRLARRVRAAWDQDSDDLH